MERTPLVARAFYLVLVSPDFGSNGIGILVPDFGICPFLFPVTFTIFALLFSRSFSF